MTKPLPFTIASTADRPREGWETPDRGDPTWFTFFSGDVTPTSAMSAGMMELAPGSVGLKPHRHRQAEIYFIAEGKAAVTIDGVETIMTAGSAAFIPGDAEHGIRNVSDVVLRVFYVFPTDRFDEVVYRFP